jgi:hypothetical protein
LKIEGRDGLSVLTSRSKRSDTNTGRRFQQLSGLHFQYKAGS